MNKIIVIRASILGRLELEPPFAYFLLNFILSYKTLLLFLSNSAFSLKPTFFPPFLGDLVGDNSLSLVDLFTFSLNLIFNVINPLKSLLMKNISYF